MSDDQSVSSPGLSQPLPMPMNWPELGPRPHEFAAIFRMLVGEERESLAANVVDKGLQEKVKLFEEKILDGRNRYLVLVEEGVFDPEVETWRERPELFEEFTGTREDALDYVWSLNAERRHDTPNQRALAAERYANLRNVTQAEAAAKFGVSERQVNSAAKVIDKAEPELVQAVEEGRLPLYLAEHVADLDEDDQREIAELPKREASAVAKQKLQEPPPLAQSGPVVKALDASHAVMFAQSILRLANEVDAIGRDTVRLLARGYKLITAQDDGLFPTPEVFLTYEAAERNYAKLNYWLFEAREIEIAAQLPDDFDALCAVYLNAIVDYSNAIDTPAAEEFAVKLKACRRVAGPLREPLLLQRTAAQDGFVPMWGQTGLLLAEAEGVRAYIPMGPGKYGAIHAVDFNSPFPSSTGYHGGSGGRAVGQSVEEYGQACIRASIAYAARKDQEAQYRGLVYPTTVYRPTDTGELRPVERGVELADGPWPVGMPELERLDTHLADWGREDRDRPRKRSYPKSKHLGGPNIIAIRDGSCRPVADYPTEGPYFFKRHSGWRFVDDGADPDQGHVARRLAVVTENDVTPGESASGSDEGGAAALAAAPPNPAAAYSAALEAGAEHRGKHTIKTIEPILRASIPAGKTRQQVADDTGSKIGSILGWSGKLELTGKGEGRSAPRPRAEAAE